MELSESEEICKNNPLFDCKGCSKKTYGWTKDVFIKEKNIVLMYFSHDHDARWLMKNDSEYVLPNFGYKSLKELSEKAEKVMKEYLEKKHTLFFKLPPVGVKPVRSLTPLITIATDKISLSFEVIPLGLKGQIGVDMVFFVAFIQNLDSRDFEIACENNHHTPKIDNLD